MYTFLCTEATRPFYARGFQRLETHGTFTLQLPKHWPRRVRSAVVHAVSMASFAFTLARSRAEHPFDVRVRLQAELDQRDREISLLREELRIKDARMERVPAGG